MARAYIKDKKKITRKSRHELERVTKTGLRKREWGERGEDKLWAFLAVFLSIIGFILVLLVKRKNKYAMYYAKQSLVLFIASIIANAVLIVPILGWIAYPILSLILLVLWFIGWVNALSGEMKPVPLIGKMLT